METMVNGKDIGREKFVNRTWPDKYNQKNGRLLDHICTTTKKHGSDRLGHLKCVR